MDGVLARSSAVPHPTLAMLRDTAAQRDSRLFSHLSEPPPPCNHHISILCTVCLVWNVIAC